MERFVAPQFIDVEDKIIGPITTRQFVMIIIGGVIVFVANKLLDRMSFMLVAILTVIALVVFGFIKINGRNFYDFVKNLIEMIKRPRVRVWYKHITNAEIISQRKKRNQESKKTRKQENKKSQPANYQNKLSL